MTKHIDIVLHKTDFFGLVDGKMVEVWVPGVFKKKIKILLSSEVSHSEMYRLVNRAEDRLGLKSPYEEKN